MRLCLLEMMGDLDPKLYNNSYLNETHKLAEWCSFKQKKQAQAKVRSCATANSASATGSKLVTRLTMVQEEEVPDDGKMQEEKTINLNGLWNTWNDTLKE